MHGACDSDAKRRSRDASGTVEGMSRAVVLRTARLTLRAFRVTDVEDALAYRNDPEFSRFLRHIPQPFTRADAEAFVQVNMTEPWETLPTFAVVHDDRVIGTVNFNIDPAKRRAMIGYAIARAYWGGGIARSSERRHRMGRRRAWSHRDLGVDGQRPRTVAPCAREARYDARP